MATFNYTVDTQPMADEMRSVSTHVNGTTIAVNSMQAAVIAAEEKAADHVCTNVNKGFYSLIRSQISQKLAKLQSDVDSYVMQMVQQKNALTAIKSRMQRDYNMISGRYIKLFNGLNANLKNRVFELDKPTIDFACKEIDKVSNRTKYLSSTVPITQLESISESQRILSSNLKNKGLSVINSMKTFIHEMNVQKKITDQILINDNNNVISCISYIPIILLECIRDKSGQKSIDIVVSEVTLSNIARSTIQNVAYAELNSLGWSESKLPAEEINYEINKLFTNSLSSQRIKNLALKLYQADKYNTI
jgi:hypothetical protein